MRHTFVQVLLATLFILVLGFLVAWLTMDKPVPVTDYPWVIETTTNGSIKVFNTHLGITTLGEFIQRYNTEPEISLFVPHMATPSSKPILIRYGWVA